jgi:hypothetical protein
VDPNRATDTRKKVTSIISGVVPLDVTLLRLNSENEIKNRWNSAKFKKFLVKQKMKQNNPDSSFESDGQLQSQRSKKRKTAHDQLCSPVEVELRAQHGVLGVTVGSSTASNTDAATYSTDTETKYLPKIYWPDICNTDSVLMSLPTDILTNAIFVTDTESSELAFSRDLECVYQDTFCAALLTAAEYGNDDDGDDALSVHIANVYLESVFSGASMDIETSDYNHDIGDIVYVPPVSVLDLSAPRAEDEDAELHDFDEIFGRCFYDDEF